ncbi:TM2 domain-containing protein [Mesorhizobium sp.]|uniref:TM2 domain-containing protein n=1 Tax=Mesorhizobium sp. TaxID=1871066 RepID=UPI000FE683BF|nr:TM2 domain-containing protein [Mesorhizobium sp.]RWA59460.1 MAG: TM2 domain-containing protein [Mesorhizobium sp.]
MNLSTQEQILIEQRVANEAKSAGVAYLFWFFLGALGAHRFYLGRTGTGIAELLLFIFGWMTIVAGVGAVLLLGLGIWVLVDAFLIPGMVQAHKAEVRKRLGMDVLISAGGPMVDTSKWSRKDRERLAAQAAREPRA